jgi:hypothetical protein
MSRQTCAAFLALFDIDTLLQGTSDKDQCHEKLIDSLKAN